MKKNKWWKIGTLIGLIVLVFALDIATKYIFDAMLFESKKTLTIIPFIFDFCAVHNFGAAWGILSGKQVFLIFLSIVFIAIFIWYYIKEKNKSWLLTISFSLIISGCLGNLYDRIFLGYVRDFIMFDFWKAFPVFNFADVALCIGVFLFVIYLIIYFVSMKKEDDKKNGSEEVEYVEDDRKD